MKITKRLEMERAGISCELFPPKKEQELSNVREIVKEMARFAPSYMSVTYGASGGTDAFTIDLAKAVQEQNRIPALAHLTCVSSEKEKVRAMIAKMKEAGIENILALRGDLPQEADFPLPGQYHHAAELIADIKSQGDFCIGGACYPEGHPESKTKEEDLAHLREKVDAGCDFLTTQMFFDNNVFFRFLYQAHGKGIAVPVVPGIMPVTHAKQIRRILSLSASVLPPRFQAIVDRFADRPAAMRQAGIAFATEQILDLFANGVSHVHLYTMNRPDVAGEIFRNLSEILEERQSSTSP